jgi:hypothetical protein
MMFNMFHGTLQPLAGAPRNAVALSEDGCSPRSAGPAPRVPTRPGSRRCSPPRWRSCSW